MLILLDDMICNSQVGEIFKLCPQFGIMFNFKISSYFELCTFYLFDRIYHRKSVFVLNWLTYSFSQFLNIYWGISIRKDSSLDVAFSSCINFLTKESVAHGVIYKPVGDLSHRQSIKSPQTCNSIFRHIIPNIPDQ